MSIVTDLLRKKIGFNQAVTQVAGWLGKVFSGSTVATQAETEILSSLKQGASNLVALADSELGAHYAEGLTAVLAAADGILLKVTGGLALPAIPIANQAIKDIAAAGKHAFDVWALEAQAGLTPPATQPPLPLPTHAT